MGRVYVDNSQSIGNTPLVKLNKVTAGAGATVLGKIEGRNPAYSVKCRIGANMIWDAETRGVLRPGVEIVEPTSGNTGIAVAMVAAMKGYKAVIVMPEHMSIERRKMIKAFGAELILVKPEEWRDAAIKKVKAMVEADKNLVMLNQFENRENCNAHYRGTGREIIDKVKTRVDYLIAGVGTGGTITGVARRLREKWPKLRVIGLQPAPGEKIEGLKSIKDGYIPPILCSSLPCADHSKSLIETIIDLKAEDAFVAARDLSQKEGLFVGASSGAAMCVAARYARKMEKGVIVTLFPDRGEKYLSTPMFEA